MPELPDVEIIRKHITDTSLNQTVEKVEVSDGGVLDLSPQTLRRRVESHAFTQIRRIGKYLFLATDDGHWLALHFGMTGTMKYYKNGDDVPKYSRLIFHFEKGRHLSYISRRKLGSLGVTDGPEQFQEEHQLGPDALEVDRGTFLSLVGQKSGMIKPALMDQGLIAGLGNVYVDELLYQAKIHPETKASSFNEQQVKDMYRVMQRILKTSVNNEADRNKMPDRYLISHRREGEACPDCDGEIKRIKVGGRSTYICPSCQQQ